MEDLFLLSKESNSVQISFGDRSNISKMAKTTSILHLLALGLCISNVALSAGPKFAPYFDVSLTATPPITEVAAKSNQKAFTLAFALGGHLGCEPMWGGQVPINDPAILGPIKAFQAQGGEVIVATGGALGPYLEHLCADVASLTNAYRKILDTVGTNHLDVDVEATINNDLVNQALARIQQERPGTTVSYTLMVQGEDYGLTPFLGVDVLVNAVKNGVRVDLVNAMTMEFGGTSPTWGETVVGAAKSVLRQMKEIFPNKSEGELKKMLGVTPMIGRNFNGRILETSDARYLVNWANQEGIGYLGFWSAGRDNGNCPGGGVSPTCSSVSQQEYEFTQIFQGFRG